MVAGAARRYSSLQQCVPLASHCKEPSRSRVSRTRVSWPLQCVGSPPPERARQRRVPRSRRDGTSTTASTSDTAARHPVGLLLAWPRRRSSARMKGALGAGLTMPAPRPRYAMGAAAIKHVKSQGRRLLAGRGHGQVPRRRQRRVLRLHPNRVLRPRVVERDGHVAHGPVLVV